MKIKQSGLDLPQYVLKQFFAVDDAQGDGYVVWNARNDYSATWKALQEYEKRAPERKKNIKVAKAPAPKGRQDAVHGGDQTRDAASPKN